VIITVIWILTARADLYTKLSLPILPANHDPTQAAQASTLATGFRVRVPYLLKFLDKDKE
jgi:hypothetical protein